MSRNVTGLKHPGVGPGWVRLGDRSKPEVDQVITDPVGEVEAKLEGLRMQENHQATKYFIKFTQLATRVRWGQAALLRQAYNGLTK